MSKTATLTNKGNHYSVFQIGDVSIKFYTSPYLEYYCKIISWEDSGYIVYTGKFSTSSSPIEDSIDMAFIAERLHLSTSIFKGIEEVKIV